jgi:hypothetical protein
MVMVVLDQGMKEMVLDYMVEMVMVVLAQEMKEMVVALLAQGMKEMVVAEV